MTSAVSSAPANSSAMRFFGMCESYDDHVEMFKYRWAPPLPLGKSGKDPCSVPQRSDLRAAASSSRGLLNIHQITIAQGPGCSPQNRTQMLQAFFRISITFWKGSSRLAEFKEEGEASPP